MSKTQKSTLMGMFKQTFDQMLARAKTEKPRRRPDDEEHRIQCACVQWFRLQHEKLWHNLFAVPNGSNKSKYERWKFQEEGLLAGVADFILLYPSGEYHALLIEMKTPTGRQSSEQKNWQNKIEPYGYKYVICRSLDDFIKEIEDYLD